MRFQSQSECARGSFLSGEASDVYFRQEIVLLSVCLQTDHNGARAFPASGPAYFWGIKWTKLIIYFLLVQIYGKVGIYF